MVPQTTRALASTTKGFTLVELIVVITILAILGTIGFLSLQGYSANARDSKRTSDLRTIVSTYNTKQTEGISYFNLVTTVAAKVLASNSIAGKTPGATEYTAGKPNYLALGINSGNFMDPNNVDYPVGATTLDGSAFQVAAKLENGGTSMALVQGNYISRTQSAVTATNTVTTTSPTIVIGAADVGKFKKGDTVVGVTTIVLPGSTTITNISGDGLTLTLSANPTTGAAAGAGTIQLAASETAGLIAGSTTAVANVVQNSSTTAAAMPY